MGKTYDQFGIDEHCEIYRLRGAGESLREIRRMMGRSVLVVGCILFLCRPASGETLVERLERGCQIEIQSYCQSVTPGEGRILLCLAAHGDKIADECKWALFDLHQTLAKAKPREEGIIQACSADIEAHCSSVTPGQGRTLICLYDHNDDLSSSCAKALIDAELK